MTRPPGIPHVVAAMALVAVWSAAGTPLPPESSTLAPQAWEPTADRSSARDEPSLEVALDGQTFRVHLRTNDELLASDVVPRGANGAPVGRGGARLLAGTLEGVEGSVVRASILGNQLSGHLHHPLLGAYSLLGHADGAAQAVPDSSLRFPSFAVDAHEPGEWMQDVRPGARNHFTVSGCNQLVPNHVAGATGAVDGWQPERTYDIGLAVDDAFVVAHGSGWADHALALANAIDGILDANINLRLRVIDLHAHAPDTINAVHTQGLLNHLIPHYRDAHASLSREGVHLFTGRDTVSGGFSLDGGTVPAAGQANCIGGAGRANLAYTVGMTVGCNPLEAPVPPVGTVAVFDNCYVLVSAHEIGHILSAHHHYANCAESQIGRNPLAPLNNCSLMFNDATMLTTRMSTLNRIVTRGWVDSVPL